MKAPHAIIGWLRTQVRPQPDLAADMPPGFYDLDATNGPRLRPMEETPDGSRRTVPARAGPG
jgi:hypothetical protein